MLQFDKEEDNEKMIAQKKEQKQKRKSKKCIIKLLILTLLVISSYLYLKKSKEEIIASIKTKKENEKIPILDNPYPKEKISFNDLKVNPEDYDQEDFEQLLKKVTINMENSLMTNKDRKFIHGLIRLYKPQKVLEIGTFRGGSSVIILNALKNLKDSFLHSIDVQDMPYIGTMVNEYMPEMNKKVKFYKGGIPAQFMEQIGGDIDFVLIDSMAIRPGELINILEILPFLKENAIVLIHDLAGHYNFMKRIPMAANWLFTYLVGQKLLTSNAFTSPYSNIGAVLLDSNQSSYYFSYFYALHANWGYIPKESELEYLTSYFNKYYGDKYTTIFKEAINFNKEFIKDVDIIASFPFETYRYKNKTEKLPFNNTIRNMMLGK